MTETLPPQLAGLLTIPEKGAAPTQRIKTVSAARKLSDALKREDDIPAYTRRLVNGLVGGAPPFSDVPADLAWMPNLNFLEAASQIEAARVPYYQLLNVDSYVDIDTPYAPDDPSHDKWNRTIAKYFHEMITRWPEWYWEYQRKDYEMLKHGIGPLMFEDYPNWRFRALDSGAMKVPKRTPSCISDRMPHCGLFTEERVHTLWKHIRDTDAAEKAGWNVANVRKAIMYAMKGINSNSWGQYERILIEQDEAALTDGDIIQCVTILVQEFNGKISRLMYPESAFTDPTNSNKPDPGGFLFEDIGKYDNYGQCVVAFFHELGDKGTWQSVKGLGQKGFRYHSVINQMNCRMLAGAEMATGVHVQLGDVKSKDAANLMQRGLVTYYPPNAKILTQVQPAGFLDGPITVVRVLDNRMAANLGQSSPRTISRDDGKGEMPTATQVNAAVTKESSLSQGQISLHYTTEDAMFAEMYRRASMKGTTDAEAKRFQEQCFEADVPEEALKDCVVKANRLSGYGSAEMRRLSDQQMLESGAVAAMTPESQLRFWRDFSGGVKGSDKVDRYFPLDDPINRDDKDAEAENAEMELGIIPQLYGDDITHCQSHLAWLGGKLGPVQQAMEQGQNDPQQITEAYQLLQVAGPHIELHVGSMQKNRYRAGEAKLFQTQLNQLVSFNSKLRGALRDIQRQQSINAQQQKQATALGALDQAKLQSARVEDTIKTFKATRDATRKDATALNNARLKNITTLHEIHRKTQSDKVDNALALTNGQK